MVGQEKDGFVFKLVAGRKPRTIYFDTDRGFKKGEGSWLAIVFNGERLRLFQDLKERKVKYTGPFEFSNWKSSYPLLLGSKANGKFSWEGSFYSITVCDQAFLPEDIKTFLYTQRIFLH